MEEDNKNQLGYSPTTEKKIKKIIEELKDTKAENDLNKSFSNALNFNVLNNKKTLKKVEDIFKRNGL